MAQKAFRPKDFFIEKTKNWLSGGKKIQGKTDKIAAFDETDVELIPSTNWKKSGSRGAVEKCLD